MHLNHIALLSRRSSSRKASRRACRPNFLRDLRKKTQFKAQKRNPLTFFKHSPSVPLSHLQRAIGRTGWKAPSPETAPPRYITSHIKQTATTIKGFIKVSHRVLIACRSISSARRTCHGSATRIMLQSRKLHHLSLRQNMLHGPRTKQEIVVFWRGPHRFTVLMSILQFS